MVTVRLIKAVVGRRVIPANAIATWGVCPMRVGYFPPLPFDEDYFEDEDPYGPVVDDEPEEQYPHRDSVGDSEC